MFFPTPASPARYAGTDACTRPLDSPPRLGQTAQAARRWQGARVAVHRRSARRCVPARLCVEPRVSRPCQRPRTADESSLPLPGWRVVFVCFVMAMLVWGFGFYGHGFYLAELQRLHGWPASLIAQRHHGLLPRQRAAGGLHQRCDPPLRRARLRARRRASALAGSAAALPFVREPWQLFAAYLVMAFGWATMSLGAINNILGLWFEQQRGLAISLALNGASFSGMVIVPALVFLAGATGFATAMLAGAALILVLSVPLALDHPERAPAAPAGRRARRRGDDDPPVAPRRGPAASALRSRAFWSVSAPFALAITSQAGFLVHQIAFLEPTIGRYPAGIAVAVTTAMAIVGRLTLGTMANRINQRVASALSLASQAAALAVMTQTTDAAMLLAACAVYGFSVGNVITFPSLIVQREFEPAAFGMLIGLSTGISQFTYAFGPGLLGIVRDATGGYARRARRLHRPQSDCGRHRAQAAAATIGVLNPPPRAHACCPLLRQRALDRGGGTTDCRAPMQDSAQTIGIRTGRAESAYAWLRLFVAVLLGTIGSVGMWAFVVALPAVQADFGVAGRTRRCPTRSP